MLGSYTLNILNMILARTMHRDETCLLINLLRFHRVLCSRRLGRPCSANHILDPVILRELIW
jgi:hypothetical protein